MPPFTWRRGARARANPNPNPNPDPDPNPNPNPNPDPDPDPNPSPTPTPGPNQAAWSKGQGYANAYLDIVNRAITSKVGDKFKPIEGTVDKAPAPVQAAAPAEAAPAEAAPAVEGTA